MVSTFCRWSLLYIKEDISAWALIDSPNSDPVPELETIGFEEADIESSFISFFFVYKFYFIKKKCKFDVCIIVRDKIIETILFKSFIASLNEIGARGFFSRIE